MSKKVKAAPPKQMTPVEKKHWLNNHLMFVIVAGFTLVLYGRTVSYDYTVDDGIFINKHEYVQQGLKGIPAIFSSGSMEGYNNSRGLQPYRPLTLTTFAIDQEIAGNDPVFGHLVNVLIYLLLALVLLQLLRKLLPAVHPIGILIIALLFFAHPSHIEVVANIKSRDELLAAFFGLHALNLLMGKTVEIRKLETWIWPFVFFLLALFSKESIITMVAIAFCVYAVMEKRSIKESLVQTMPLLMGAAIFLLVRQIVLPQADYTQSQRLITDSTLFGNLSFSEAWGTRFGFLLEYLRILIWPYPLSWDYSFNQLPIQEVGSPLVMFSVFLHVTLLVSAFWFRKKLPLLSFSILFYFLAFGATNNILLIIGANVAERLLFLPSLGFVLFLYAVCQLVFSSNLSVQRNIALVSGLGLVVIYSIICLNHIPVWQSNYTLFKAGAQTSPNSSRANIAFATVSRELASKTSGGKDSVRYYYHDAIKHYNKGLAIYRGDKSWNVYLGMCYLAIGDTSNSISSFVESMQGDSAVKYALHETTRLYGAKGNFDSSVYFGKKMVARFPADIDGYLMLAGAYYGKRDVANAITYAQLAYEKDSTNVDVIRNLANLLGSAGDAEKATYYQNKLKR